MKSFAIEFTEKQCDTLAAVARRENNEIHSDDDAEAFIHSKLDVMLSAPDMYKAIKEAMRLKHLLTYDDDDYLSKSSDGKALIALLESFNQALAKADGNQ